MSGSADARPLNGQLYAAGMVHDAPCGFLVTDTRERGLYANATLGHWLDRDPIEIGAGFALRDILTRESHLLFQTQVAPALQLQGFVREISCRLRINDSESALPVLMNAAARAPSGNLPARVDFVFFDARERLNLERRLRERRAEAEELAALVRGAASGILRCDAEGRIRRFNRAAAEILSVDANRVPEAPIDRLLRLEEMSEDWFAGAIAGRESISQFEAGSDGRHYNITIAEIESPEEPYAPKEYSVILRDVSQRVRAEKRMELLVGELNHRIRNVFSVVTGLVRQSLRKMPDERDKLIERLGSIADSHEILTRNYWKDANIREIFAQVAAQAGDGQKVLLDGPDLRLGPSQFKALSMAVHELATNARKYGAFSRDTGTIEIVWSADGPHDRDFSLTWRERGGPPVAVPEKSGFGTNMIERVLAAEFDGSADVRYPPEGLNFTFHGRIKT